MSVVGPEFSEIQPRLPTGSGGVSYRGAPLVPAYAGLDAIGTRQFIAQTFNRFRIGQTIFFEFEWFLDVPGTITAILLQPWWLREQQEFRAVGPTTTPNDFLVGPSGTDGVDVFAFGAPDVTLATTHRLWQTDTKREDQIGVGPPVVPTGKSYSNLVDNVWRIPVDGALVVPGYSKRLSFHWPAHGLALAFTSELEGAAGAGAPGEITDPTLRISWKTGATHSITQENVE